MLLLALLIGGPARGQENLEDPNDPSSRVDQVLSGAPFTITADEVAYEADREIYEATGNVRVEQPGGGTLEADWVTFSTTTRVGIAVGNVRLEQGGDVLEAGFATVDLQSFRALATDATLKADAPAFVVSGETLEKTGELTYRAEQASFTTCRCSAPGKRLPWEVEVEEADIEVEGYAEAKNAKFKVLGVPVLYSPWLLLPVKTKRTTGFLVPDVETSSRNGVAVETPFFWAAREDLNLTLRPRFMSRRGLKTALDFEYVFDENAYSEGGGAFLGNDRKVSRNDPETPFSSNRWAYWLRHEQPLGDVARFGTNIESVSDNSYPLDFEDDLSPGAANTRFLESSAWISGSRSAFYAGATGQMFDDLQSPNNLDRDKYQLQRLPDVTLTAFPVKLGPVPVFASADVRYTYFYNDGASNNFDLAGTGPVAAQGGQFFDTGVDGLFDGLEPNPVGLQGPFPPPPPPDNSQDNFGTGVVSSFEGDGVFQEGELLADRGQRIDLFPRLSLTQGVGPLDFFAEGGWRQTLYSTTNLSGDSRGLWAGRASASSRLRRDVEVGGVRLSHLVEPSVSYVSVSKQSQSRNPLLVAQSSVPISRLVQGDLRLLTRNPSDRIAEESLLLVSVENRVLGAPRSQGFAPAEVLWLRLSSGYDFERGRLADWVLESRLDPSPSTRLDLDVTYDSFEGRMEDMRARAGWQHPAGHELRAGYRYNRNLPLIFEQFFYDDNFNDFDLTFRRINQLDLDLFLRATRRFDLFLNGNASFEASTTSGTVGFIVHSACSCWNFRLSVKQTVRPNDTSVSFQLRLAGLGEDRDRSRARVLR